MNFLLFFKRLFHSLFYRLWSLSCSPSSNLFFLFFTRLLLPSSVKLVYDSIFDVYLISELTPSGDPITIAVDLSLSRRIQRYFGGLLQQINYVGESYCIEALSFSESPTIIDCGANLGEFFLYLCLKNISCRYIAFEPGIAEINSLRITFLLSRQFGFNPVLETFALSDFIGFSKFYYSPIGADSSLFKPSQFSSSYDVECITIDHYLFVNDIKYVDLIKIEGEGFEPEILSGASMSMANFLYITCDLGPERGPKNDSPFIQVHNFLNQHGFKLLKFSPRRLCFLYIKS